MLRDILACVEDEPATGPWYGVRYSETTFGIFEAFPSIAGRQAHVDGGGGASQVTGVRRLRVERV